MLTRDIHRIRNDAVEGLSDHGKIGRVLKKLKSGGVHIESILEKKVHSHPWKAPETLYKEPEPQNFPGRVLVDTIRRDHESAGETCITLKKSKGGSGIWD